MSVASLRALLRMALSEVCGLSAKQAAMFTTHSLRVGGINFFRRLGAPIDLRAQMADHANIESSRRYLRMPPTEQFAILDTLLKSR